MFILLVVADCDVVVVVFATPSTIAVDVGSGGGAAGGLQRTVRSTQCTNGESGDETRAKTNPSPTTVTLLLVVLPPLLLRVALD